jgi:polar amino acid transport system substrate-binding protein
MNSLKVWDICNIANEAKRASTISFSVAYCEIEATYMVPSGSSITRLDQGWDFVL